MSACKQRSIAGLVVVVYVLALLACTLPGQESVAGGKPTVSILAPTAGTQVSAGETLTVQIMAVDAQGVTRVELRVDNIPVATQNLPQPVTTYQGSLTWATTTPGPHVLLVQATNAAGTASDPAVLSVLVVPAGPGTAVVQPPATLAPTSEATAPLPTTTVPTPEATVPLPTTSVSPTAVLPTVPPTSPPTVPPTPKPTKPPTTPPLTGKIAFPVLNEDRVHYDTWVVNAGGTNARLLVKRMRQPCFRSDGAMLAVNGEAHYQDHIIIMNADGSDQREVSQHVEDSHPSWSPEGNRLVYDFDTTKDDGKSRICIVGNLADPASWRMLPDPGGSVSKGLLGQYPTWMPDGRIIFKTSDYWAGNLQAGLYITAGGAGIPQRVTSSPQDTAPAVHGSTVAFMSTRQEGDYEIYTASAAGGVDAGLKQVTDNSVQDGLPAWSPDGKYIAFMSDEGGAWGLWVMRADGSGRHKLLNLPGTGTLGGDWNNERVSWAP